jgi:choice-of-anchor A domain-containing protein
MEVTRTEYNNGPLTYVTVDYIPPEQTVTSVLTSYTTEYYPVTSTMGDQTLTSTVTATRTIEVPVTITLPAETTIAVSTHTLTHTPDVWTFSYPPITQFVTVTDDIGNIFTQLVTITRPVVSRTITTTTTITLEPETATITMPPTSISTVSSTTTQVYWTTSTSVIYVTGEDATTTLTETKTVSTTITQTVTTTIYRRPTPTSYNPAPTPTCIDMGPLAPFNGFFLASYFGSSDVQGRLAIGGDASFAAGFSVGDQIQDPDTCKEATLVIGGRLQGWKSGRNYFGNIIVGEGSSLKPQVPNDKVGAVLDNGCRFIVNPDFFDFSIADWKMQSLSAQMASWFGTVKSVDTAFTTMTITLSGTKQIEVVEILNGSCFTSTVKTIALANVLRQDTLLVFNIYGDKGGFVNINMEQLGSIRVIFNFIEATQIELSGVAVRGMILAPFAHINGGAGVTWGNIFAYSMSGPHQINQVLDFPMCSSSSSVYFLNTGAIAAESNVVETASPASTVNNLSIAMMVVLSLLLFGLFTVTM